MGIHVVHVPCQIRISFHKKLNKLTPEDTVISNQGSQATGEQLVPKVVVDWLASFAIHLIQEGHHYV